MKTKISKDDKFKIIELIKSGKSFTEIASNFGVSKQRIYQISKLSENEIINGRENVKASTSCIYPNISKWMRDNNFSFTNMSYATNIEYKMLRSFLIGEKIGRKDTIDKILKITGLTYEEAFYQENN